MEKEIFTFSKEDIEARRELESVLAIMERRMAIGITQAQDYKEALEKREREQGIAKGGKENRDIVPQRIEDIADTLVFDWDGVLLDSMERVSRGAAEIIKHLGKLKPNPTVEDVRTTYESPFWDYYRRFGVPVETEADRKLIFSLFHDKILPNLAHTLPKEDSLFPEVQTALPKLKQIGLAKNSNFQLGIVSAANPESIRRILEQYGLEATMDFAVGAQHSKTEALLNLCRDKKLDPNRIIYFGDLPSDIRDVRNTGLPIKVAAVATFDAAEDKLASYDPDYLVHSISEEIFLLTPFYDDTERSTKN